MSTSEIPKLEPVQTSSSSPSTSPTRLASGNKRRRDTEYVYKSDLGVDHEGKNQIRMKPDAEVRQEQDQTSQTPCQYMNFESEEQFEFNPPQSKRRITDFPSLAADSQPLPQAWSQDPLLTYSQYCDSELYLTHQQDTSSKKSEPSFCNSLQSEEAFGIQVDLEGRFSTQKSFNLVHSSHIDDKNENNKTLFSYSPSKHSSVSHFGPISNHKWTESKTASPQKHITNQLCDKEESHTSQIKWAKPKISPKKQVQDKQSREVNEDSLAMLFTQDSEGFRVIAHRGLPARSPLKDQTNICSGTVRSSAHKCLGKGEEEDEMLFTQDSQGYMVIKH